MEFIYWYSEPIHKNYVKSFTLCFIILIWRSVSVPSEAKYDIHECFLSPTEKSDSVQKIIYNYKCLNHKLYHLSLKQYQLYTSVISIKQEHFCSSI